MSVKASGWTARDASVCWHPYTQHGLEDELLAVREASGSYLVLDDGRRVIDAISSWWSVLHGHSCPEIVEAIRRQAERLDHVLFAGTTHQPAVELAEALLAVTPPGLGRVFYSDNGSTAIEVALKMSYQSWLHRGQPERQTFLALDGGYHGDTFGAMSVGDPNPFFSPFGPFLFDIERVPPDAEALEEAIDRLGRRLAAVVVEPLVQGACGMRFHPASFVRSARELTEAAGVFLIADEVATGFGRTGSLFACEQVGVTPDFLCLAKGLSGGVLPLAATVTREEIFEEFLSGSSERTFLHGHTFTANPIACAAGIASLELVQHNDVPGLLDRIGSIIERRLRERSEGNPAVRRVRRLGGIVAFDYCPPGASGSARGYHSKDGIRLRRRALERGVLLRPLGNVVYAMPPASTDEECALTVADTMAAIAESGSNPRV